MLMHEIDATWTPIFLTLNFAFHVITVSSLAIAILGHGFATSNNDAERVRRAEGHEKLEPVVRSQREMRRLKPSCHAKHFIFSINVSLFDLPFHNTQVRRSKPFFWLSKLRRLKFSDATKSFKEALHFAVDAFLARDLDAPPSAS